MSLLFPLPRPRSLTTPYARMSLLFLSLARYFLSDLPVSRHYYRPRTRRPQYLTLKPTHHGLFRHFLYAIVLDGARLRLYRPTFRRATTTSIGVFRPLFRRLLRLVTLSLYNSTLCRAIFRMTFRVITMFFRRNNVIQNDNVTLLRLLRFRIHLLNSLQRHHKDMICRFTIIIRTNLLGRIVVTYKIVHRRQRSRLTFLHKAIGRRHFLRQGSHVLTFIVHRGSTFICFFISIRLFGHLFPRTPTYGTIKDIRRRRARQPPRQRGGRRQNGVSLRLRCPNPNRRPSPPTCNRVCYRRRGAGPRPIARTVPPILRH